MSNEITVTCVETAPMAWAVTTKGGDVVRKTAHCATSQVFVPKAVRLAAGQSSDLTQLINGTFRPMLRSIDAKMTDKEKVKLWEMNVSVSREKPSKNDMVPFATAVVKMWATAKGEKAAIVSVLRQYVDSVTGSVPAATQALTTA